MASSQKIEDQIMALKQSSEQDRNHAISAALSSRSNVVITQAAQLAAHHRCHETVPHLAAAFQRLMQPDAIKRDKGCLGKTAIIKALFDLDFADEEFYSEALGYSQFEAVWGDQEDVASEIRATAALGFVATNPWRAIFRLIEVLNDPESQVRIAAARAIGSLGSDAAEAVLRQKALAGDHAPDVTGECFSALLDSFADDAPGFVAHFLHDKDGMIRDLAAFALGSSKIPSAIDELKRCWDEAGLRPDLRESLIQGLALACTEHAFLALFEIMKHDGTSEIQVVRALAIYRHDERIRKDVESRVSANSRRIFDEEWND
ncbi:MAG: HEAT repeat domain-containing protein [Verrucomicrobiota bacterium]